MAEDDGHVKPNGLSLYDINVKNKNQCTHYNNF